VREHRGEDRVDKNKAPANRETPSSPTRETHVTFGHDGGKVPKAKLVRGEGEAKVGLGESGDLAAKDRGHISGSGRVSFDGDEGTFMEVDCQTRGSGEIVKDFFQIADMLRDRADNDKSIVSIL
jgi:hypothetical protein